MTKAWREKTRAEFARQSAPLSQSGVFRSESTLERVVRAAGVEAAHSVADVGCGPGIVSLHLARDARRVVGIDLTPEMLARARADARVQGIANAGFVRGGAEELPLAAGSCERVVTRLALHHLPDPDPALREMKRVLAPGGRLVVADVVASEDPAEAALHNALERLRDPSHVRMLAKSELLERLGSLGLEVRCADEWTSPRDFEEWLAITGSPYRAEPLRTVMSELAERGADAGISLRVEDGRVRFEHRWLVAVAGR